ncbi:hypothetical protein K439DRAFT_1611846 [Ramaria rubella]|nr:hypothetical protein K439DRAFT_1611846 [Ramaria rubella]
MPVTEAPSIDKQQPGLLHDLGISDLSHLKPATSEVVHTGSPQVFADAQRDEGTSAVLTHGKQRLVRHVVQKSTTNTEPLPTLMCASLPVFLKPLGEEQFAGLNADRRARLIHHVPQIFSVPVLEDPDVAARQIVEALMANDPSQMSASTCSTALDPKEPAAIPSISSPHISSLSPPSKK